MHFQESRMELNQMMDILSYVYEFPHKKIYEHLIPYNFLKFYCLKSKSSGNVLVMFRQCWAMSWQCSAMFVIIQSERSDYENKRTLFRYPGRRHKV